MRIRKLILFCFQLRYLQTLTNISAENNSTIVFPVPLDILSHLLPPDTTTARRATEADE